MNQWTAREGEKEIRWSERERKTKERQPRVGEKDRRGNVRI